MDLDDLKTKLFGAAEAVIMNIDHPETARESSPSPKRVPSRYRAFSAKKNRFRASPWNTPSRNPLGSFCSLSSFGSSQELADLQEDAKCRRISSEIFKHRLYETVLCRGPSRRRCLSVGVGEESEKDITLYPVRYVQSMPATPVYSETNSPIPSPKTARRALLGLSKPGARGSNRSLAERDARHQGLACILQSSSSDSDDLDSLSDLELDCDIDLHIEEEGDHYLSPNMISADTQTSQPSSFSNPQSPQSPCSNSLEKASGNLPGLKKKCKGIITRHMLADGLFS